MKDNINRKILIIGNGFDIAHHLPTRYIDFLDFFKNSDDEIFSYTLEHVRSGLPCRGKFSDLISNNDGIRKMARLDRIQSMEKILRENVWAKYFAGCEADIVGWIDFEREMLPVFNLFQEIFLKSKTAIVYKTNNDIKARIEMDGQVQSKRAALFDKYFIADPTKKHVIVTNGFSGLTYGVFKEKLLDDLRKELDLFIEAFGIYLEEIVGNIEVREDPLIQDIHADVVLSFNYTSTEYSYRNLEAAEHYYVHGSVGNTPYKMVMGVDKVDNDGQNEFIYFEKYFQRMRKGLLKNYNELVSKRNMVMVYGHSLDKTDIDILELFLGTAEKVKIFYYNEEDYERKTINLIKMFGRNKIEEDLCSRRIEFIATS